MVKDCIFCQIANKVLSSEAVYEDKKFFAFKDIHPIAPFHILIIPKKHIASVSDLSSGNKALVGELVLTAKKIAQDLKIESSGYRLIFNVGEDAGQTVGHIHLHLLGGKKLSWF